MIQTWRYIITVLLLISLPHTRQNEEASPRDWRVIETIAEKHPYIVALLNATRGPVCSGTIISERGVLTSGRCVRRAPRYVAAALAALGSRINNNSLFTVSHTVLHEDYVSQLSAEPNLTQMHSNIGLVYTIQSFLEIFYERADIGNYYASELIDKQLTAVGYGQLRGSNVWVLQNQWYHQSPCLNPKWYYCVCGFEYATMSATYEEEFGEGGPVLVGTDVVAVAAVPCGVLAVPISAIKYSIFTVIGPYRLWLEKPHATREVSLRAAINGLRDVYTDFYYTQEK